MTRSVGETRRDVRIRLRRPQRMRSGFAEGEGMGEGIGGARRGCGSAATHGVAVRSGGLQDGQGAGGDLLGRDGGHATEIDGTLSKKARGAGWR